MGLMGMGVPDLGILDCVVVTGGAGFIGSQFVREALDAGAGQVRVLDSLSYAGNLANLEDLRSDPRLRFILGNICDASVVDTITDGATSVVNFAAESHVDRSLLDAASFIDTNVYGTYVLLNSAHQHKVLRFVQVSTDEVYGDIHIGYSKEGDRLHPRSPYSASKAGGEMMALAYAETFGVQVMITRGSNTYGPRQYPEKLIPLMITNIMENKPLPIYGDGHQIRDWIHVADHCDGILKVLMQGSPGQVYNIGGGNEIENGEVVRQIMQVMGASPELIRHVPDRQGHDRRYALNTDKLRALGWSPEVTFSDGLRQTIDWYQQHQEWWKALKDSAFSAYYDQQYGRRLALASMSEETEATWGVLA